MGERLRILFVAPYEPSSLAVRSRLLLSAVAERHDVDLLTLRRTGVVPATMGRVLGAYPSRAIDRVRALRHVPDRAFPFQAMMVASAQLSAAVKTAVDRGEYDLIHVEHVRALPYLPVAQRPPVLLDAVDCVSQLFVMAARERRRPMRWIFAAEAGRLARFEMLALASVDRALVASERDAVHLRERNRLARISVLPNPVDVQRFAPGKTRQPKTVVMSGKMSFHANDVAARWLCTEIWPQVQARHPDARLVIAGSGPTRALRRWRSASIDVTGYVEDLGAVIGSAAVAVAPLRYAVGVQNKVLEALACSTPVVATPAALGDLSLRDGREIFVAGTAGEFAARVSLLLSNPAVAGEIGAAGRRYVERWHSISASADQLEAEYRAMLQREPSRSVEMARAI